MRNIIKTAATALLAGACSAVGVHLADRWLQGITGDSTPSEADSA